MVMTGILLLKPGREKNMIKTVKIGKVYFREATVSQCGWQWRDRRNLCRALDALKKDGVYRLIWDRTAQIDQTVLARGFLPVSHGKLMRALALPIAAQYMQEGWHLSVWCRAGSCGELIRQLCGLYDDVEVNAVCGQTMREILSDVGNAPALFERPCKGRLRLMFCKTGAYDRESPGISVNLSGKGPILPGEYGNVFVESMEELPYPQEFSTDICTVLWETDPMFLKKLKTIRLLP